MHNRKIVIVLALFASSLLFQLIVSNPAVTTIAVFTLTFAAALGWNIISGYTGYLSLGHAAFYGLGAYALTFLCQLWQAPGGLLPFLLTGICALPLGWVALKTRRYVFMVLSIAIFALCARLPDLASALTTSMAEISLPIPSWGAQAYKLPFYYAALVLVCLALGICWSVRHSRYGLGLLAIRDDEDRALRLRLRFRSVDRASLRERRAHDRRMPLWEEGAEAGDGQACALWNSWATGLSIVSLKLDNPNTER